MAASNLYQSVVRLLSNVVEAYTTAFFTVDSKSRQVNLIASQSMSKYLDENATLPLEQSGILSQVHKVGQTIHLDKMSAEDVSSRLPFYRAGESHIKGLFAIPVGDCVGILYADTKYSWGFSDKQQKWIREIADLLEELLGQQECLNQQKSYSRILELWYNLDQAAFKGHTLEDYSQLVVNECTRFLGIEYGFLALKEPQDLHCRLIASTSTVPRSFHNQSFAVERGLIGWIFQNQRPMLIGKLNLDTSEHFLFHPGENLPRQGTFWGLPAELSLGHAIVLAFLSRHPVQWDADDQYAVSRILHFFHFIFEQLYWKERFEQLKACDLCTGLYNCLAFEACVDSTLASSMRSNMPFTLAILQFEPWDSLYTKTPPKEVRKLQREFAADITAILPSHVVAGQIAENRYGILFLEMAPREVDYFLSKLIDINHYSAVGKLRKTRMQIHAGWASFPQDATRSEELWPFAYQRLFADSHSLKGSPRDTKSIDR